MRAFLGDWVKDTSLQQIGRVTRIDPIFIHSGADEDWFQQTDPPLLKSDRDRPWYHVLLDEEGSILVPERLIEVIKMDRPLKNMWAMFYFRDASPTP